MEFDFGEFLEQDEVGDDYDTFNDETFGAETLDWDPSLQFDKMVEDFQTTLGQDGQKTTDVEDEFGLQLQLDLPSAVKSSDVIARSAFAENLVGPRLVASIAPERPKEREEGPQVQMTGPELEKVSFDFNRVFQQQGYNAFVEDFYFNQWSRQKFGGRPSFNLMGLSEDRLRKKPLRVELPEAHLLLGSISVDTPTLPRELIDLEEEEGGNGGKDTREMPQQQQQPVFAHRILSKNIELCFDHIMEYEDCDKSIEYAGPQKAAFFEKMDNAKNAIQRFFGGDDRVFMHLASMSKGIELITKCLDVFHREPQLRNYLVTRCIFYGPMIIHSVHMTCRDSSRRLSDLNAAFKTSVTSSEPGDCVRFMETFCTLVQAQPAVVVMGHPVMISLLISVLQRISFRPSIEEQRMHQMLLSNFIRFFGDFPGWMAENCRNPTLGNAVWALAASLCKSVSKMFLRKEMVGLFGKMLEENDGFQVDLLRAHLN
eukprot:TRINITY_DN1721_c0_g1_i1.p1 TRINITY_DN1721_c0_g1~~TRINITY_DN1721_c0_g1_i1.p1  ORF type:complete len:484 (-),score=136.47 TRINITY_DN1721_c0_g1_i1:87-1538(-)